MTTEDVLHMKQTLAATGEGTAQRRAARKGALVDGQTGDNIQLRRSGAGLDAIRRAHETLRAQVLGRYGDPKTCFKEIDADGSGLLRRAELQRFLRSLSKSIPDRVLSGLIKYVDSDGDAKTLSMAEFERMMGADFLM